MLKSTNRIGVNSTTVSLYFYSCLSLPIPPPPNPDETFHQHHPLRLWFLIHTFLHRERDFRQESDLLFVSSDMPGTRKCSRSHNLPSHCQRRSVQRKRRSRNGYGECDFNIYQHMLYHDHGKGLFYNHNFLSRYLRKQCLSKPQVISGPFSHFFLPDVSTDKSQFD